jgi:hypothetical protein
MAKRQKRQWIEDEKERARQAMQPDASRLA